MSTPEALQYEQYYHIYNRGNNRETLFRQERNYHYFMELYARHIYAVAETFAYCLLPNHFHFAVRIKSESDIAEVLLKRNPHKSLDPGQNFGNLFNAYTKTINNAYGRTGSLFEKPFHRKPVTDDNYFRRLVLYIHRNPQKHGLIDDFRLWPFSSYASLFSDQPTRLIRDEVLAAFGDIETFIQQHDEFNPGEFEEEF
ncbi:MAG: transposase [Chloroflexi bacterium]|nr:transposase [Chloroflexota bacterium]